MTHKSSVKLTRSGILVLLAAVVILFVLLNIENGMSHWLWLVLGANYASLAMWAYLDREKPRALAISHALWSVCTLAQFYEAYFPKPSSGATILQWIGVGAALSGVAFLYIGRPELYTK